MPKVLASVAVFVASCLALLVADHAHPLNLAIGAPAFVGFFVGLGLIFRTGRDLDNDRVPSADEVYRRLQDDAQAAAIRD